MAGGELFGGNVDFGDEFFDHFAFIVAAEDHNLAGLDEGLDEDAGAEFAAGHLLEGLVEAFGDFADVDVFDLDGFAVGLGRFGLIELFDPLGDLGNVVGGGADDDPAAFGDGDEDRCGAATADDNRGNGRLWGSAGAGRRSGVGRGAGVGRIFAGGVLGVVTEEDFEQLDDFGGVALLDFEDVLDGLFDFGDVQLLDVLFDAQEAGDGFDNDEVFGVFFGDDVAIFGQ